MPTKKSARVRARNNTGAKPHSNTISSKRTVPWYRRLWVKLVSLCAFAVAAKEIFYPIYVDYREGKLSGEMVLTLGDIPLNRDMPTYVFFPAGSAKSSDRFLVPIRLKLRNEANNKASEVTLSSRYAKKADRMALDKILARSHSGPRLFTDLSSEVNGNDQYDYAVHRLKYLPPKEKFTMFEGAMSYSIPPDLTPFEPLLYTTHHGLDVQVSLASERDQTTSWEIRYRAVMFKEIEQIPSFLQEFYAKQVALDLRRQLNTADYLWGLFFGREVTVAAYAPDFGHIAHLGVYAPQTETKDYVYFRFDPYKWSLLLDKPSN